MFYEVIPTRIFRQGAGILTYHSDQPLTPGQVVLVPLGKKTVPAIVWQKVTQVDFPTRPITKILYSQPLPSHLLKSLHWLSEYYLTPLPTVAGLILPVGVEKKRRQGKQDGWRNVSSQRQSGFVSSEMYIPDGAAKDPQGLSGTPSGMTSKANKSSGEEILRSPLGTRIAEGKQDPSYIQIPLNPAQKQALKALQQAPGATKLLHGVTGSGKTNIYLTAALNALKQQKSTILLVPEIALTSQLVTIFQQHFPGQVVLLHSQLTEAQRHLTWQDILQTKQPRIIIGPRSALFAPVNNLGLIIIDEAHESAYFQENAP
ncbi:DEAD/DEAH box helicase family protein, partial [Candidatus Saccharibacteria bacterium]|nr:DEAD/DEAH box helicase family protein [Candidatus Saccharibacteria bacterium]